MKSRICINALALQTGGGLAYVAELVPQLRAMHGAAATRVLVTHSQLRTLGWRDRTGLVVMSDLFGRAPVRLVFEALILPFALIAWRCSSVLMCGNLGLLVCPVRQVIVQHASHKAAAADPARVAKIKWRLLRLLSLSTARAADAVVYVSNALQQELTALGFPAGRVIHHGANPAFHPVDRSSSRRVVADRFGLLHPYVLCVADIYAHKNLALAVRVLRDLRTSSDPALTLVIAGAHRDPAEVERLQRLSGELGVSAHVKMLGSVTRHDLRDLYNAAEFMLAPSLAESFGMPLLEAQSVGLPVVCARIPAFQEVAGDAARYFDPHDAAEASSMSSQALRLDRPYEPGIAHARRFSWDRAARMTLETLAADQAGVPDMSIEPLTNRPIP